MKSILNYFRLSLFVAILMLASQPRLAWSCACGCGVFEVGTSAMLPTQEGGMLYFEFDTQNQSRNWRGESPSSADNNGDKQIISNFFSLGARYMLSRSWGVSAQIPYTGRYFKVADEESGDIMAFTHSSIGDIQLRGIYSGLSDDMSTGLTFGIKLPTGSTRYDPFDPDVQIGSGSTDLLVGAYQMNPFAPGSAWYYFANTEADVPAIHYHEYVPGSEVNAAAGVYFNRWRVGPVKVTPLAQVVGTHRWSDAGALALSESTGFSRILLSPGIEIGTERIRLYTDVGFRVYEYTTGDQLIASQVYKVNLSYHF